MKGLLCENYTLTVIDTLESNLLLNTKQNLVLLYSRLCHYLQDKLIDILDFSKSKIASRRPKVRVSIDPPGFA